MPSYTLSFVPAPEVCINLPGPCPPCTGLPAGAAAAQQRIWQVPAPVQHLRGCGSAHSIVEAGGAAPWVLCPGPGVRSGCTAANLLDEQC